MRALTSIRALVVAASFASCTAVQAQQPSGNTASVPAPQRDVLDRVVAVVNNRAILVSDIDEQMRLAVLEPRVDSNTSTPAGALQRIISRTLIQQQFRQEDTLAIEPTQQEIDNRIAELRKNLPACVRANCTSDAGWAAFLASHGITTNALQNYMHGRSELLNFIENRFRGGIRIPQEDIEHYYRDTLLPQYAPGTAVPPLSEVSTRIEEILLQQQVNALFSAWLDNLRKQGDVEILDPAFETAPPAPTAPTAEAKPQ
jgi:hypothetical protein